MERACQNCICLKIWVKEKSHYLFIKGADALQFWLMSLQSFQPQKQVLPQQHCICQEQAVRNLFIFFSEKKRTWSHVGKETIDAVCLDVSMPLMQSHFCSQKRAWNKAYKVNAHLYVRLSALNERVIQVRSHSLSQDKSISYLYQWLGWWVGM